MIDHVTLNLAALRFRLHVPWVSLKGLGLPTTQPLPSIPEESLRERASTTHPDKSTVRYLPPAFSQHIPVWISDLPQSNPSKWSRRGRTSKADSTPLSATQFLVRYDLRNDAHGHDSHTQNPARSIKESDAHCGTRTMGTGSHITLNMDWVLIDL